MSAVFLAKQRDSVHLISDTVGCHRGYGTIITTNLSKCVTIPLLNMAVAYLNDVKIGPYFSIAMTWNFTSFDDVIDRGEKLLPKIYAEFIESEPDLKGDCAVMYFIGWHERENRPGAYCMNMWKDKSAELGRIAANSDGDAERFKFSELLFISGTPLPKMDALNAAGFRVPANADDMVPERDLLHLLEIARQQKTDRHFWIGGKALLTSIDRCGITQRIVREWAEDQNRNGKTIEPAPVDWAGWRAARSGRSNGRHGARRA